VPDAGQMDALQRAMNLVGFSLFSLYFAVYKFPFPKMLMDFFKSFVYMLHRFGYWLLTVHQFVQA
jgi:hypothetical protein